MYKRCVTRVSHSAIAIAIDSSISMQELTILNNTPMPKMEAAALIANFIIDELIVRSTRAGIVLDYFDIAVLRYSGDGVESILASEDDGLTNIKAINNIIPQPVCYNIQHKEKDGTEIVIPFTLHEWVTPKAHGIAPMYEALVHIKELLSKWCDDSFNSNSFPPIVFNITDGCCSDADDMELMDVATEIRSLGTRDGSALLVNIYLANGGDNMESILFPSATEHFSQDHDCQILYDMSSTLPMELEYMLKDITGCINQRPYKCFARNSSICEIVSLIDIGTDRGV